MADKEDALRELRERLLDKFGAKVSEEVLNEIFDAGAWFGVEFITGEIERRAAKRVNNLIDRSKMS